MMERIVLLVLIVFVLGGCASIQTATEQSPDVDFREYSTWDWIESQRPPNWAPPASDEPEFDTYIRSAIETLMSDRRYVKQAAGPDLRVDYHVTSQDMVNATVVNNYYGESWYPQYRLGLPGFQDVYKNRWEEGALLVLVFDDKTKELVWRGIARTEVNSQGPVDEIMEIIDKAVDKLLKKLPKGKVQRR
jgi:uncharacterized protein YceK